MVIHLNNTGKRFNRDWIFRKLSHEFSAGNNYAIVGPNGSGKSTLLQVLAASLQHNEGLISWRNNGKEIEPEQVFNYVAIAAPYLELVEEFTVREFLQFHAGFKPLLPNISIDEIIDILDLTKARHKQIRFYSSGMKQRVKLAQAIFSNVPVIMLDEPCTNLDATGYELYHNLIKNYHNNRTFIISSNDPNEYSFCNDRIDVMRYKS